MTATAERNSTGRAVLLEMFWPTNIRSATPTEEISALSLNRLTTFDSSGGTERSSACGNTTYSTFTRELRPRAMHASCCSPAIDLSAPRKVSLVIAPMYRVRAISTDT
ncbi:hypothetical protein D3C75_622350 [compost metagenome]